MQIINVLIGKLCYHLHVAVVSECYSNIIYYTLQSIFITHKSLSLEINVTFLVFWFQIIIIWLRLLEMFPIPCIQKDYIWHNHDDADERFTPLQLLLISVK